MGSHFDFGWARRIALGLAALTLVATAVPADAAYKRSSARFKVKLTLTQTSTWSENRRDDFEICGNTFVGNGKETMRLATKRAQNVFVMQFYDTSKPREEQALTLYGPFWQGTIAVNAVNDRAGTMNVTPNSPEPCADGGDGSPPPQPPAPDCGRKTFPTYLELRHSPVGSWFDDPAPLTGVLVLDGPKIVADYENCPGSGNDRLLMAPNASFTVKKVMGKARTFVVRGREHEVYDQGGYHRETTLNWKATFTRVPTGKPPKPAFPQGGGCDDNEDNDNDGRIDDQDPDCFRTKGESES